MAFSWDSAQTLLLGVAGLAIAGSPSLNRARRSYRLRARLKQDLELIEAADKVKLEGTGPKDLRLLVDARFSELAAYERQAGRRATTRRAWLRRAGEFGLAAIGIFTATVAVVLGALEMDVSAANVSTLVVTATSVLGAVWLGWSTIRAWRDRPAESSRGFEETQAKWAELREIQEQLKARGASEEEWAAAHQAWTRKYGVRDPYRPVDEESLITVDLSHPDGSPRSPAWDDADRDQGVDGRTRDRG